MREIRPSGSEGGGGSIPLPTSIEEIRGAWSLRLQGIPARQAGFGYRRERRGRRTTDGGSRMTEERRFRVQGRPVLYPP